MKANVIASRTSASILFKLSEVIKQDSHEFVLADSHWILQPKQVILPAALRESKSGSTYFDETLGLICFRDNQFALFVACNYPSGLKNYCPVSRGVYQFGNSVIVQEFSQGEAVFFAGPLADLVAEETAIIDFSRCWEEEKVFNFKTFANGSYAVKDYAKGGKRRVSVQTVEGEAWGSDCLDRLDYSTLSGSSLFLAFDQRILVFEKGVLSSPLEINLELEAVPFSSVALCRKSNESFALLRLSKERRPELVITLLGKEQIVSRVALNEIVPKEHFRTVDLDAASETLLDSIGYNHKTGCYQFLVSFGYEFFDRTPGAWGILSWDPCCPKEIHFKYVSDSHGCHQSQVEGDKLLFRDGGYRLGVLDLCD